ncbi:hypothetical protein D3C80_1653510 [compost metagenome]
MRLGRRRRAAVFGGLVLKHLGLVFGDFLFLLLVGGEYRNSDQGEGEAGGYPVVAHGRALLCGQFRLSVVVK